MAANVRDSKVGRDKVIRKGELIGKGESSRVFSGIFDGKDVAIKRVDQDDEKSAELECLRDFQHENIVRYLYKDMDEDFLYIVMEKCELTLQEYIQKKGEKWKNVSIISIDILWQTANGLSYLHEKNIIHRDLKPSNTLLTFRDGKWLVRIADFGISKKLPQDRSKVTQTSIKGTVGNMAPEVLRGEKISKKSDIFSLGIVYYFTLSGGEHPFGSDMLKIEARIRDRETPTMEYLDNKGIPGAKALILLMIADACEKRIDINQVQAHHLFWDDEKSLLFIQEVSDYSFANRDLVSALLLKNSEDIIGSCWRTKVYQESPIVQKTLEERRSKKQEDDIISLLRTIRNLKHHFHEKTEEFKMAMNGTPCGMLHFFTLRFPDLISHAYNVMRLYVEVDSLKSFYGLRDISPSNVQPSANKRLPSNIDSGQDVSSGEDGIGGKRAKIEETREFHDIGKSEDTIVEHIMEVDTITQQGLVHLDAQKEISKFEKQNNQHAMEVDENPQPVLTLRKYQWELAQNALEGQNSLIIAPTGSGKTVVLAEVIRQHIIKSEKANSHVVFMVPKTALAHQQFGFLERHLPCTVDYIVGANVDSAPAGQKILNKRVIVLTPQILINELKSKESYARFGDISMLIFDECHHATKKHPYKEIMDMFLDAQSDQSEKFSTQIVGVTASPGVGKAKDRSKVRENLLTLLANLNIMSIPSMVEKNLDELKKHQNEIRELFVQVETETQFTKEVEMVMASLEMSVKRLIAKSSEIYCNKIPIDKSKQSYAKWTDDVIEYAKIHVSNQEDGRSLITYAKHLKMYFCLLQLKDLIPNAMKHTNKLVEFQEVGFDNIELNKKNKDLQRKAEGIKVPMLEKLFDIIKNEFEKNADARCIVFVKTRLTAISLHQCIAENPDLTKLQPSYVTGKHAKNASEATSDANQRNILKRFKDGYSKVLVATSVVQEGHDVVKCNLIIMYNHVTGEVGRIQRAGRGRAAKCRSILITSFTSDHVRQEENNRICAEASEIAITDLKKTSSVNLENEILKIQVDQLAKRKRKANLEPIAIEEKDPSARYEILCGDCSNFLTTGDKLRHIENMHAVIEDVKFLSRVIKKEVPQQKGPNIKATCNFHCNNPKCGIKVALGMLHGGRSYPTLSIKKIKLRRDDGKINVPKQKKNLPFVIDKEIGESDKMEQEEADTDVEDGSLDLSQALELLELLDCDM